MSTKTFFFAPALAVAFSLVPAFPAVPYRVADLDPTFHSAGSRPDRFGQVGSRALFLAHNPGLGLWSSTGTAAGTVRLLKNQTSIHSVAATGELAFLSACTAVRCRLLVTDGTVAGTRPLLNSFEAAADGTVAGPRRIFFVHATPARGAELWTSDGTRAGTRMVKDLAPGPASSSPFLLVWGNDRLWFFRQGDLWTSDGRAAGTRRIATVGNPLQVGVAGSRLLFFAQGPGTFDVRLYSSDGTSSGTRVLPAVAPFSANSIAPFATNGATAYFAISRSEGSGSHDEVWASDGTPARTRRLAQLDYGAVAPKFVFVGPRVGFVAFDRDHGTEMWTSNGTPAGTRPLDVCPGFCSGAYSVGVSDGSRVWFSGVDDSAGGELWTSDLTPAGTRRVKDIVPGNLSSSPEGFLLGGGKAYFSVRDFNEVSLWASDGTAAGTRRLVGPSGANSYLDLALGVFVGGRAFLRLDDAEHGSEPWVSDGTPAGTTLLSDLEPSQDAGSFPYALQSGAGRCFFFANADFQSGKTELWSSDGSAAGTQLAVRFDQNSFSPRSQIGAADLGDRIALIDSPFFDRAEIWISDGTADGTFRVDAGGPRPTGRFRAIGRRLFFEAFDAEHGVELWTSDGTPAGTLRLSDFDNPEPFVEIALSQHSPFRVLGDRLEFLAADSFGRFEPWVSDGTIGGTRYLADVYPALAAPFFELSSEIVPAGGRYFFVSGEESEVGTEPALWVSDLSAAGTHRVGPLQTSTGHAAEEIGLFALGDQVLLFFYGGGAAGFWRSDGTRFDLERDDLGLSFRSAGSLEPTVWNGRLVFLGTDDQLYTTDGTGAGTEALRKANGEPITSVYGFALVAGRLAYTAFDGIWETDGTPAGTVRRLAPHEGLPGGEFLPAAGRVFFPFYEAANGTEIWALRPWGLPSIPLLLGCPKSDRDGQGCRGGPKAAG